MPEIKLIGKEHNNHLDWLLNTWMSSDSPVCFLEGFPGTGKTTIARELLARATSFKKTAVMITVPETEKDPTDDLLLDLAMELNSAGRNDLVKAIENNRPLLDILSSLVNDPVLIIIDEFQRSMLGMRAITLGGFAKVLSTLANRKWLKGRILLITNRLVERARWSEPYAIRTLQGMSLDDGMELLEYFAQNGGRINEISDISHERRRDIVKWLGGNPRAIRLLVRNLAYESLSDLIGEQPELWEMKDREVSVELVEDLERNILKKTLNQLSDEYILYLHRLSVLRKPFQREAIEQLFSDDKEKYVRFRDEMIDRFLMERHKNWFNLHPIVREISLQKLALSTEGIQQAHSIVANYYTRHFEAKQIVGWGVLGGYFVEARYHLIKADKVKDLQYIASLFRDYIFSTLSESSTIPNSAEELDERIAVLSALLETPGPKSLEYHLARLFQARNQRNDLRRGLHHVRRAVSNSESIPPWLLYSELLAQTEQTDEAISVLKQAIRQIPSSKYVAPLYDRCARLLSQSENFDEAIKTLQNGINSIPPDKALVILYNNLARLLLQMKRYDEAIAVLKQGIDHIPPDKALSDLYSRYAYLLVQTENYTEAIKVLEKGIDRIPFDKGVASLYIIYCDLLIQKGKQEEAFIVLRRGINCIPPSQSASVYFRYGELLAQFKQIPEAIEILMKGIQKIPYDKGVSPIYALCSDLLFSVGRQKDAKALLREGINHIPQDQGISLIFSYYAKLLIISNQEIKAIETLRDGIRKINYHQNAPLVEFLLYLYASLQQEQELFDFTRTKSIQSRQLALAQMLLYQVRGNWIESAEYARRMRDSGISYHALITTESFSWLCAKQPKQALDVISRELQSDKKQNYWLHALIQLRLGDIEGAKQSITVYDPTFSSKDISEVDLLNLWGQPSSTLKQFDLAYYFPILPCEITGFPHPIMRITYQQSPMLSAYFEANEKGSNHPNQKKGDKLDNVTEENFEFTLEKYTDFDLYITSDGHITASSSEGEVTNHISTQISNAIRLSLQLIKRQHTDAELIKEIGIFLYNWLFPNTIHTHLQQTEAIARRDKAKLRLRMRIESSSIASLPLEFIYRETGSYFLAANPSTVFSRYLNLSLPAEHIRRHKNFLHMLVIIADPIDQVRLDSNEWELIIKTAIAKPLSNNQITLHIVKRATRREIRDALLKQKPDIIQFVGYNVYKNSKEYLALVDDETNNTWTVDDEHFANLFMGFNDHLGLISLVTCEGAQIDEPQSFLSIAPQLVQRGTPAVIAMQYSVPIKTAKVFLDDFYTAVAARKPIDWAMQSARNAISMEFGLDNREFASPVLYMRAKDGNIF